MDGPTLRAALSLVPSLEEVELARGLSDISEILAAVALAPIRLT